MRRWPACRGPPPPGGARTAAHLRQRRDRHGTVGVGKGHPAHILGALDRPDAGSVAVDGRRCGQLSDRELTALRGEVFGFVFQFFNLLPTLSAAESVLLPALVNGERPGKLAARVDELIGLVGLTDRAAHLPTELCGGEQQRIAIRRARRGDGDPGGGPARPPRRPPRPPAGAHLRVRRSDLRYPAPIRWFKNEQFDFEARLALGAVARGLGDVGEVVTTVDRIKDGDYESWHAEWAATGRRLRSIAEECERGGHTVSAREAYLRACSYLFISTSSLDGTDDPDRLVPVWREHRECFARAGALSEPPFERFEIPYEDTSLEGWFFAVDDSGAARPTVILNNGSDGPVTDPWGRAQAARARGYNAMTFDGPGQGRALWEQGIPFRHDWEAVITPVVDALLERGDVDGDRLGIVGISQGGYWVPRAVAFEKRIAAAVADPGVMDVAASWEEKMPKKLVAMVAAGEREKFERNFHFGEHFMGKTARQTLAFRMKPYGTDSVYEVMEMVRRYRLDDDVVGRITTPMLVLDPEDEQFWPGQPQRLYEALPGPEKAIVRFTAAEGANGHCEPMATQLQDQRVFDWLDDVLKR